MSFKERVDHYLSGLESVSTGGCPGCPECGIDAEENEYDTPELGFSSSPCECCDSSLGGDRHAAHGVIPAFGIVHLEVCTDCLFYIEYGEIPAEDEVEEEEEEEDWS